MRLTTKELEMLAEAVHAYELPDTLAPDEVRKVGDAYDALLAKIRRELERRRGASEGA